jgi:hypothetical protein
LNDRELVLAAAQLARASPEAWEKFIAAFDLYAGQKMGECVSADISMLAVAQGRAQACAIISNILKDCKKTAEKIYAKAPPSA